jgi:hypothetical protein
LPSAFAFGWQWNRENSLVRLEISDYKDKLSGASPTEAKARIDALEARIGDLEPRRLTNDQQRTIVEHAGGAGPHLITVVSEVSCTDSAYGAAFARAFHSAGWQVATASVTGPNRRAAQGLAIIVPDPSNISNDALLARNALAAAKIEFELMQGFAGGPPDARPSVAIQITAIVR